MHFFRKKTLVGECFTGFRLTTQIAEQEKLSKEIGTNSGKHHGGGWGSFNRMPKFPAKHKDMLSTMSEKVHTGQAFTNLIIF